MKEKKKLSDIVALILQKNKIKNVFGVQGGAVVHLFDSIHRNTNIKVCYNHHEQASALAAVSNSKLYSLPSACIVTTGPAATNALTGLLAAWQDSCPVIFISGQTRKEQTSYGLQVRQRGSQECNILDVVSPWTKNQILLDENSNFEEELQGAINCSLSERMGPVWIDIPVNLQWLEIENNINNVKSLPTIVNNKSIKKNKIISIFSNLKDSSKPLVILGRNNYPEEILNRFYSSLSDKNIPIATTWGSAGSINSSANNVGIIGMSGQQSANLMLRISDLVIIIGCHLSATQTGNNYNPISKSQKLIYINIDKNELNNLLIKNNSEHIVSDGKDFINSFLKYQNDYISSFSSKNWNDFCYEVKSDLSPIKCAEKLSIDSYVNPHLFISYVYSNLSENDCVVIDGGGCALYAGFQCIPYDKKFKVICSTSISAMGTGLPELIGASINNNMGKYFCIIGDGSLMFNLQELQTIKTNCPECCIIVLNNNGYLAIRHTQEQFLDSRFYGTSPIDNGVNIPSIKKIANAFEYDYLRVNKVSDYESEIKNLLKNLDQKHIIIELIISPEHKNLFTASFKKNNDNTFSPNDIHLMQPFENYEYRQKSNNYSININE